MKNIEFVEAIKGSDKRFIKGAVVAIGLVTGFILLKKLNQGGVPALDVVKSFPLEDSATMDTITDITGTV